jgi:hypothetical protein
MMKKKLLIFFPFLIFLCCFSFQLSAQSDSDWQPVKLDVAGHSIVKDVEAVFQKKICNNEEMICVKFINHNKYAVTIKWYDAILTKGNSWVKKENSTAKKTLDIEAQKEISGDCSPDGSLECIIKLKDFIDNTVDYQLYAIYRFEVLEIKK